MMLFGPLPVEGFYAIAFYLYIVFNNIYITAIFDNLFQNSSVGTPLISLQADDGDVGDNAKVDLSFVIDDAALPDYIFFKIEVTGRNQFVIKQNTSFDRETKASQYKVTLFLFYLQDQCQI